MATQTTNNNQDPLEKEQSERVCYPGYKDSKAKEIQIVELERDNETDQ